MRDVHFGRLGGSSYLEASILGSKADRFNQGGREKLMRPEETCARLDLWGDGYL